MRLQVLNIVRIVRAEALWLRMAAVLGVVQEVAGRVEGVAGVDVVEDGPDWRISWSSLLVGLHRGQMIAYRIIRVNGGVIAPCIHCHLNVFLGLREKPDGLWTGQRTWQLRHVVRRRVLKALRAQKARRLAQLLRQLHRVVQRSDDVHYVIAHAILAHVELAEWRPLVTIIALLLLEDGLGALLKLQRFLGSRVPL